MELIANRSFSGDEVKRMLTGLYEVLAKAEKYAKEKEKEANEANVRSRALEKVILYGDFQEAGMALPPPPPTPTQQQSNLGSPTTSCDNNNNNNSNINNSNSNNNQHYAIDNTTISATPSQLHYSRNTNAAQVLKSAIKETETKQKMKYEHQIETYKVEK